MTSGHLDIVLRLLQIKTLNLNPQNKNGDTPLHKGAWKGHAQCVKAVLTSGADPRIKNNEGKTPESEDPEVLALLGEFSPEIVPKINSGYNDDEYGNTDDEDEEEN